MLAYSIRIAMQAVVVSGFYGVPSGHCKPSNFHQQSTRIIYNFKVYILVGHRDETLKITIYTGDVDTTPEQILIKAKNTFNISVDEKKLDFVFLKRRKWIEAQQYPYFTLLGQSLGSLALGLEALFKHQPGTSTACFGILFDNSHLSVFNIHSRHIHRHHGLCFHTAAIQIFRKMHGRLLCALSDHQHGHAETG